MSQFTSAWLQQYENRTRSPRSSHTQQRQCPPPLAVRHETEAPGAGCPVVRFTLRRVQLLDVDAKYGSVKDLLDGLRHAGLIRGDKEGEVDLQVRQERVKHYKDEATIIEIEYAKPQTNGHPSPNHTVPPRN